MANALIILSGIYNVHDVCELWDSWTGLYVAGTGEQHSRRERGDWTNENVQWQKGLTLGCTCLLFLYPRSTWEFIRTRGNVSVRSRSNWNLEALVFKERGKPNYPEKNLSEKRREPTRNSTHIWRRRKDYNPGHVGYFSLEYSVATSLEKRAPHPHPHPLNWRGLSGGLIVEWIVL